MKPSTIFSAVALALSLGACANAPIDRPASPGVAAAAPAPQPAAVATTATATIAPPHSEEPAPDAIIKIDPKSSRLAGDMDERLQRVAEEARKDDRLLIRLEGYVPGGGSPTLNLSLAEQMLQVIKERLQDLGVPSRRLLPVSFGEEHDEKRDPYRYWVEVYFVRTGPSMERSVEARQ